MGTAKISPIQLFCLMFIFELGSAIVVGLGIQAKQDAWLAILLGMVGGMFLFLMYGYFYFQYPKLPLTSYIIKILGKYIGTPLSFVYILYFLYIAARVLRDFGDLLITSTLRVTPLFVVNGLMMLLISYGVYQGIEVIGRTGETIFSIMVLTGLCGLLITIVSGIVKPESLFPFLENGLTPVLKTVFLQTFTFPFGEIIAFTMILPYLNKSHLAKKTGLYAILASGFVLSMTIVLEITILGPKGVAQSQFPLLETVSKVNIANFIQRLDILVVITLILGVFMKIMIFFYAAVAGIADLFRFTKQKQWVFCICILSISVVVYSIQMSSNFTEHIETGIKKVPIYIHLPLQTGIPFILFIITLLRKKFGTNKMNGHDK